MSESVKLPVLAIRIDTPVGYRTLLSAMRGVVSEMLTARSTTSATRAPRPRLAELVAALSLGIDLGFGQPMEHVLRQCLIALRLADHVGLDDERRSAVYFSALLIDVGCHTDAHEQAKWWGDDIALKSTKYDHDMRSLRGTLNGMRMLGAGNQPLHRFRVGLEFFLSGHKEIDNMVETHSQLARALARELSLPDGVQEAVATAYERWDGRGWPGDLAGDAIPLASRLSQLAEYVEVAHRLGGASAALALAKERSGGQFDPALVQVLVEHADEVLGDLDKAQSWDSVIAAEPALGMLLRDNEVEAALTGVADFVDLKSPYTLGHSRAVADLVTAVATAMSLPAGETTTVRRAALVAGFGRLGVSNAIWDKHGPLGAGEWERVRMHPYLTERMLRQSVWLAPYGAIAVQLRERLDGSGYPRGLTGGLISTPARILAAADAYQSMIEPRAHREALPAAAAATELKQDVIAGRLDSAAVAGVLEAAGHARSRRLDHAAGLTGREVDVLRLLARGMSSKQIAERLVISPKTARNHIEHIYAKIGASSRATASLFAMQQGLLPEQDYLAADA
jgi:HD-GYP domain-containing protein (c-di-GMP phosphodiesterase class II)